MALREEEKELFLNAKKKLITVTVLWTNGTLEEHLATTFGAPASSTAGQVGWREVARNRGGASCIVTAVLKSCGGCFCATLTSLRVCDLTIMTVLVLQIASFNLVVELSTVLRISLSFIISASNTSERRAPIVEIKHLRVQVVHIYFYTSMPSAFPRTFGFMNQR